MAMNKFMHRRNMYKTPPDFAKLAEEFEEFRAVSKTTANGKVHIDFKDELALRTLTLCLLKRDFDLTVELPPEQLVPTLPLRLNYILWIEDILNTFKLSDVIGLDIGCGASCIYPLLATKKNPSWRMFGIELNEESIEYARKNINQNALSERIQIFDSTSKDDPLDALDQNKNWKRFDFTMCNPPFFKDESDSDDKITEKRKPSNNAKTGISCELKTAGGEVEFVSKIIQRSKELRKKINIFTTMLGHKSSVNFVLQELKIHGITNFCISEFCQGWTKRWGIAWTFRNDLPLRRVPVLGQTQPKPPLRFLPNDIDDPDIAAKKLYRIIGELSDTKIIKQEKFESGVSFQLIAISESWKNQRRKRRQQAREQKMLNSQENPDLEIPAEKRIRLEQDTENIEQSNASVESGSDSGKPEENIESEGIEKKLESTDVESTKSKELIGTESILDVLMSTESPPLIHIEVRVESKTLSETKAIVEVKLIYLNGTSGLNGVYGLLQYIQNKWIQ